MVVSKRRGLEPGHDEHVNVTPLIDIVMCLIIFFMICGKLVQDEVNAGITVPKARNAEQIDQNNRLVINIMPVLNPKPAAGVELDKQVVGAKYMVRNKEIDKDEKGETDPRAMTEFLRREKALNPDLRLLIRADRNMPYPFISPVIVSCAQADIKSMHFATGKEVSKDE
jgi:biopolymer transport protein ExbD